MAEVASRPQESTHTDVKNESGMFWKAETRNDPYWDAYLAARPKYSADFYNKMIEYYEAHNSLPSGQSIAHDVGTGPGQVAAELGKYFDRVVASDPNATHLAVAEARNEESGLNRKIEWRSLAAENLKSDYSAGSAAFLAAAECLPLLDVPRAMDTFAHLLRPDGTLAAWFYGRPHFADANAAAACQPILNAIIDATFAPIIQSGDEATTAVWKRSTDTLYSFLDNIALPEATWRDVYRHKWNPHLPLSVVGPDACNYAIEASSAIEQPREKVVEQTDPTFWEEDWNVDEVRRFVECLLPNIESLKAQGFYRHVDEKYDQLAEAMGGRHVKQPIMWPVVLILATRQPSDGLSSV